MGKGFVVRKGGVKATNHWRGVDISFLLLALELFVTLPLHWPLEEGLVRNVAISSGSAEHPGRQER